MKPGYYWAIIKHRKQIVKVSEIYVLTFASDVLHIDEVEFISKEPLTI